MYLTYAREISALDVQDLVHQGVQLVHGVVVGKREGVGACIAIGVGCVEAGFAVEWLRDVADEVDQQTECIGLSQVGTAWVQVVGDVGVHVRSLVFGTVLAREPVGDVLDAEREVVRLGSRHVPVAGSSLVDVGNIDEVEVRLPGAAVVLDVVGEGRTLDERVIQLVRGENRIVVTERLQHDICRVPTADIILQKQVLCNICDYKVN